jgi:hypothetical protein
MTLKLSMISPCADYLDRIAADNALAQPLGTTPAEFGAFLSSEMKRWAAVVKSSGMRVE